MNLTTKIEITKQVELSYDNQFLLVGSCFTENISKKLSQAFFRTAVNPFGVLYNPLSIAQMFNYILSNKRPELVPYNGLWHSMLHHGSFSASSKETTAEAVNRSIVEGQQAIKNADVLIITFGTAWVYEQNGMIVSNCHKMPATSFVRRRLSVEHIANTWTELMSHPQLQNKRFIFTVSPIRHLNDGLHENQLSKSTLLLAIDKLTKMSGAEYFPSYEIVMDELRDYRFYAEDMLHISSTAVDYIWERFRDTYFSKNTQTEILNMEKLYMRLQHRVMHQDTPESRTFNAKTTELIKKAAERYPWVMQTLITE